VYLDALAAFGATLEVDADDDDDDDADDDELEIVGVDLAPLTSYE